MSMVVQDFELFFFCKKSDDARSCRTKILLKDLEKNGCLARSCRTDNGYVACSLQICFG